MSNTERPNVPQAPAQPRSHNASGSAQQQPPQHGGTQGSQKLPFTLVQEELGVVGPVRREAVMPDDEVAIKWQELFDEWNVRDDATKTRLFNEVLAYLIVNGASPRGNYKGHFNVGGNQYEIRKLKTILETDIRRFARAHADDAKALLLRNRELRHSQAERYGFPADRGQVAFDFSDFCTDLSEPEIKSIRKNKFSIIGRSSVYKETKELRSGSVPGPEQHGMGPSYVPAVGAVDEDDY